MRNAVLPFPLCSCVRRSVFEIAIGLHLDPVILPTTHPYAPAVILRNEGSVPTHPIGQRCTPGLSETPAHVIPMSLPGPACRAALGRDLGTAPSLPSRTGGLRRRPGAWGCPPVYPLGRMVCAARPGVGGVPQFTLPAGCTERITPRKRQS